MFTPVHDLQILQTVIRPLVVLVVDVFSGQQWAPDGLLHDVAMLEHIAAVHLNHAVALRVRVPAALPTGVTTLAVALRHTGHRAVLVIHVAWREVDTAGWATARFEEASALVVTGLRTVTPGALDSTLAEHSAALLALPVLTT